MKPSRWIEKGKSVSKDALLPGRSQKIWAMDYFWKWFRFLEGFFRWDHLENLDILMNALSTRSLLENFGWVDTP